MGAKARKASRKALKKASSQFSISDSKTASADFLEINCLSFQKPNPNKIKLVLYIGRIPHGFYEKEMEAYFKQFGAIKSLRIARNKKTGKSKHFGFIEFENPQVAEVVADYMHNYLLFEHLLQVHIIPTEHVHPKLWRGFNYKYKPVDYVQIERQQHNKVRTLEEHKKLVEKILKQVVRRRKRIEAAGIDYECPEIARICLFSLFLALIRITENCQSLGTHGVGSIQPAPKKIKFNED
ncbi:putative lysyl-tRNA synthetase [Hibiscus syriacus]|uniref:Lysyl-tRNA synthetase n=1 Tax=Hibiscus syriacus TaxID=106335 RepID=A0A6A2XUK7_HIBSY|nr:putative lysyl-tRNA synthetase [Hibiscus syriacus]